MSTKTVHVGDEVQLYADQTAAPTAPAAGAGKDIRGLRSGGNSEPVQLLEIVLGETGTTITLTGPVKIYAEHADRVSYIGKLNGGDDIVIAEDSGHNELLNYVGIYDRLEIVPASVSGGGGFDAFLSNLGGTR